GCSPGAEPAAIPRRAPESSRSFPCRRARGRPDARSCARTPESPSPRRRDAPGSSETPLSYTCRMAATATDWVEVRSPYSGDVVGRAPRSGAEETRQAIDAAERALETPLPAHKRAEILVKVAGLIGRRHEEVARTICEEAGKPIKTARVEASRA